MGFNTNSKRSNDNNDDKQSWTADGFINIVLAIPGQPEVKLPSLALQASKHSQNLVEWLNEDPSRVAKLGQYLKLDYKRNAPVAKVLDFSKIA